MSVSRVVREGMEAGSWIRRMFEEGAELKARYGADEVFDLSLGNPLVEPPAQFRDELWRLVSNPAPGMHRYMPNAGYPETRAAVAEQLVRETGVPFTLNDVIMTCGAAGGLNVALKAILNPGDEVIVLAPYFPEYLCYIENHGGAVSIVATGDDFIPRIAALEEAIGERTRAVIINSPNNPTGVIYPEEFLQELGALLDREAEANGGPIFLISDEPYRHLVYDEGIYPAIWSHTRQAMAIASHSKDLALPGERIGYLAVHPECPDHDELLAGLIYCNRVLGYVNAPALMQRAVAALQSVTVSVVDYQRKRDFLYRTLTEAGYSVTRPAGAFYLFPRSPVEDDVAFVRELQQYRVLVVPGRGFGTPGYFRIAYCVDERTLEGAGAGFKKAALKYNLSPGTTDKR